MKKRWVVVLLLVVLLIAGCDKKNVSPLVNKEKLHDLYFDTFEESSMADKKSGTLESGMDWESYSYTFDEMIITVTYYKGRDMNTSISYLSNVEDVKINDISYKFSEIIIDEDYKQANYYTQVGSDTYYISAVYKDSVENRKTLRSFLDTVRTK